MMKRLHREDFKVGGFPLLEHKNFVSKLSVIYGDK